MKFGILGPLLVHDGAAVQAVAAAKQRALLAALLVRHGHVVPVDQLAEVVWDGRPPRSAPTTLRNYVMRLRQGLGAAGERIETRSGGYLIRVLPGELDAQHFVELRDQGVAALRGGAAGRAVALLDEALALWRGAALVDVPAEVLRQEEAGRLAEIRLDAVEARLDAALRLGRAAAVIPELRTLTTAHPERERFWAQLMTALYHCGRQSEALGVYRQVHRILADEVGVEPGAELRAVQQRILAAEQEPNGWLEPVPGVPAGDEPDEPLADPPAAAREEAARPGSVVPFQLPASLADFTGRADELATLTTGLTAPNHGCPPVAVVTGPPGAGKSALAGQAAHAARAAFPDGVLYADLRGSSADPAEPAELLRTFLLTLGVTAGAIPAGPAARVALYRSVLAGRRLLVVLDDARDSAQVRPLLPSDTANATVITSRNRLGDLLGALRVELGMLTADEAEALLRRTVGPDRVAADPLAAAAVAALCGRLPLALRICAARLVARPSWRVRDLADRLSDDQRLLDELRIGGLDVRTEFARSYAALDPAAARAFRLLALLDGGLIRLPVAAALLDEPVRRVEELLEQLADAHLLIAREPGRYGCHSLLRAFARERSLLLDPAPLRSQALLRAALASAPPAPARLVPVLVGQTLAVSGRG
ncbi:BTAD domain-containing putative transcriptional regulator [Kitasatospora sp. NPDC052896]|uniref:AfsR/SARP family transcriptional regulator n=1 Tax=Kitasatospora sp. NPDC052896 TaxID=3364061 RepID=UPI0037C8A8B5